MSNLSANPEFRTLAQRGQGSPFDPALYGEIVKPGELIDIVELSPLTLVDRRIYNVLIANAWERIAEPIVHRVAKSELKGTHKGNERIEDSLLRLMGTIAMVTITKDGKSYKRRVQLLGSSDESLEKNGFLHYRIPEDLIEILRNSQVYARLKTQVMYCFESKYSLCLYEMIERRIGLSYKQSEDFTLEQIRGLLNVPAGKLERFADLNKYCLKVAIDCNRSHLSKVRSGARPLSLDVLEKLIPELQIDRKRAAFAVNVMGSPDLYFEAAFANACYLVEAVLRSTVELTEGRRCSALLASLSKEACESLAQQSSAHLAQKFAAVDSLLETRSSMAA